MIDRQEFLIKLAKTLMTFGAPSHRIESQLIAAARILEVEAEFIHLPSVIICSFGPGAWLLRDPLCQMWRQTFSGRVAQGTPGLSLRGPRRDQRETCDGASGGPA